MKSTKNNRKQSQFPKLQIASNGNVFLMYTATKGTCVHSASGDFLGEYSTLDSSNLTNFNGSITLEN